MSELESVRQERDILQDELRSSQHTVDSIRSELAVSLAASVCVCGTDFNFFYYFSYNKSTRRYGGSAVTVELDVYAVTSRQYRLPLIGNHTS